MCKRFSNFFAGVHVYIKLGGKRAIKGEACDLVARPEAENSGEASFHPWPGRMFTGTWSKGFRSVPRSTLGWCRAPSLPAPGQPWILSRSHPFHVIVTAKSVVVTRVRADKPCNLPPPPPPPRIEPNRPKPARLRWKQTALLYSWLSTLGRPEWRSVELAASNLSHPSISTVYPRTRSAEEVWELANLTSLPLSLSNIGEYWFSFVENNLWKFRNIFTHIYI